MHPFLVLPVFSYFIRLLLNGVRGGGGGWGDLGADNIAPVSGSMMKSHVHIAACSKIENRHVYAKTKIHCFILGDTQTSANRVSVGCYHFVLCELIQNGVKHAKIMKEKGYFFNIYAAQIRNQ